MAAIALRLLLIESLGFRYIYIMFYPAVMLAALYGGFGPGILVAVLSCAAAFSVLTPGALSLTSADVIGMALFFVNATLLSCVVEAMHRAQARVRVAVDELKTANARLRQEIADREQVTTERASLAAVVHYSDDAIITKNLEGRITSWNAAAQRIFGYSADEVIGRPISILLPEGQADEEAENLARIRRGETIEHYETRRRRKDGEIIDIALTHSPLRSPTGAIVGSSKIARDITERKRAAEAMLHSQREERARRMELEALMEAVPAIVWISRDPACRHITGNRAGSEFLRQVHGQDLSRTAPEAECPTNFHVVKDGRVLSGEELPMQKVAASGKAIWGEELEEHFSDGTVAWIYGNVVPLLQEDGNVQGAIGVFVDITKRKLGEQQLATARDAAESANRAKDKFLAMLSHELRTPLTPVLMLAAAMEKSADLTPELQRDFAMIRSNIELEAQIIDDLLDVTRITQDKLQLDFQPCNAHTLIHRTEAILRADIEAKQLSFHLDLAATGHQVLADSVRLQQVFWNVVKNAVKFTPVGGTVTIRTFEQEGILHVDVSDTGMGIAAADLTRIFDAFAQTEEAAATRFGGLGLGLTISALLIRKHRGRIWAESPGLGRGTTFHIEIPLAANPIALGQESTTGTESLPGAALRILLIEDHDDSRETLTRLLNRRGYDISAAATAARARQLARDGTFDLVICDRGLPDGDGHVLMSELRRDYGLPGIALSGFGMESDVQQSLAAGFLEHLTKPVNLPVLEKAIARVIAKAPLKRRADADVKDA